MCKIEATHSVKETAQLIFHQMIVNQSVAILGYVRDDENMTVEEKGKLVIQELEKLDIEHNFQAHKDGALRRKRSRMANSIGGFIAQKIFKYERREVDNFPRYTIWRLQ